MSKLIINLKEAYVFIIILRSNNFSTTAIMSPLAEKVCNGFKYIYHLVFFGDLTIKRKEINDVSIPIFLILPQF